MKNSMYVVVVLIALAFVAGCNGGGATGTPLPTDTTKPTDTPALTGAPTTTPTSTATPMPVGTWKMTISGVIYDSATDNPISGASIRYEVVHSYFPEVQEGWPNATVSNEQGQFKLPMIVHDTDNIRLVVEAPGYLTYEEKLDLFGNRSFNIGLTAE